MTAITGDHSEDRYSNIQSSGRNVRVVINPARIITDLNTGRSVTIVPVLPARSNPGMAVYMDQETGREITVIENNYGAR